MTELLSQTTRKALKKNSLVVNEDGTPKMGRAFFYIGGMLMLMAALLVWAGPVMAEEALPAEAASGVDTDAKSAPCKGLKPFNNLEELLYQFYINLDSDCLFKMPIEELEKVWDTKIVAYKSNADKDALLERDMRIYSEDFRKKPYKNSALDGFYIEAVIDAKTQIIQEFKLIATIAACEAHMFLLPTDRYPKGLPEPIKSSAHRSPSHRGDPYPSPDLGKYYEISRFHYFWLNKKKNRMILLGGGGGQIDIIQVRNYMSCFFTETNDLVRQGGAPCRPY